MPRRMPPSSDRESGCRAGGRIGAYELGMHPGDLEALAVGLRPVVFSRAPVVPVAESVEVSFGPGPGGRALPSVDQLTRDFLAAHGRATMRVDRVRPVARVRREGWDVGSWIDSVCRV